MPGINFTIFKEKVVSGEKKQTIRERKTDHWLRWHKGDSLHVFWKWRTKQTEKLFVSELSEDPFVIKWKDFDDELMVRDGFESLEKANREWFIPEYGKDGEIIPEKEFVVLRWCRDCVPKDKILKKDKEG